MNIGTFYKMGKLILFLIRSIISISHILFWDMGLAYVMHPFFTEKQLDRRVEDF